MVRHGHSRSDLRNLRLHRRALEKLGESPELRATISDTKRCVVRELFA